MPATLFVVATPIGNLEDISARALRVLREVSLIAAEDTRRTGNLLARYAIQTPTTSLHEHNESHKATALVERLKRGESIALVSDAGTPTVSDPGARVIRQAIEAGVRVEPIPGPSAALAALAVSGLPTDVFTFLGFPPTRSKDRKKWLVELASCKHTAIFFEAPHRILATLRDVQDAVGNQPVCVGRELTKAHEELVRGPISDVLNGLSSPRGEYTVVINLAERPIQPVVETPTDAAMAAEFGDMTNVTGMSRRAAISALAKRYGRPAREIYAAVERAKDAAN